MNIPYITNQIHRDRQFRWAKTLHQIHYDHQYSRQDFARIERRERLEKLQRNGLNPRKLLIALGLVTLSVILIYFLGFYVGLTCCV